MRADQVFLQQDLKSRRGQTIESVASDLLSTCYIRSPCGYFWIIKHCVAAFFIFCGHFNQRRHEKTNPERYGTVPLRAATVFAQGQAAYTMGSYTVG